MPSLDVPLEGGIPPDLVDSYPDHRNGVRDFPPGSPGSEPLGKPPAGWLETLRTLDPDAVVAGQPVLGINVIWSKTRDGGWVCRLPMKNPFMHKWADLDPGEPMPYDNRPFALLYDSDPRTYGGFRAMRRQVVAQMERDAKERENRNVERHREAHYLARMHTRISTGYGPSAGNKSLKQNNPELALADKPPKL